MNRGSQTQLEEEQRWCRCLVLRHSTGSNAAPNDAAPNDGVASATNADAAAASLPAFLVQCACTVFVTPETARNASVTAQ